MSILPTQSLYIKNYGILDELVCCGCSIQFIVGEFRHRTKTAMVRSHYTQLTA